MIAELRGVRHRLTRTHVKYVGSDECATQISHVVRSRGGIPLLERFLARGVLLSIVTLPNRAITCGKVPAFRFYTQGIFAENYTLSRLDDAVSQRAIRRRIYGIQPARHHCDSASSRVQCSGMGDGIDAQGQAAHNGDTTFGEFRHYTFRDLQAIGTRIARADHRQCEPVCFGQFAVRVKNGRRVVDLAQKGRIERIFPGDHPNSQLRQFLQLLLRGDSRTELEQVVDSALRDPCLGQFFTLSLPRGLYIIMKVIDQDPGAVIAAICSLASMEYNLRRWGYRSGQRDARLL